MIHQSLIKTETHLFFKVTLHLLRYWYRFKHDKKESIYGTQNEQAWLINYRRIRFIGAHIYSSLLRYASSFVRQNPFRRYLCYFCSRQCSIVFFVQSDVANINNFSLQHYEYFGLFDDSNADSRFFWNIYFHERNYWYNIKFRGVRMGFICS